MGETRMTVLACRVSMVRLYESISFERLIASSDTSKFGGSFGVVWYPRPEEIAYNYQAEHTSGRDNTFLISQLYLQFSSRIFASFVWPTNLF